ncbi:MAG: hypothetical protein ACRCXB_23045 [Aeromonadaceae bacterium]
MKIINKLTQFIDRLYSRVTGRKHRYFVTLGYRPKGHTGPQVVTVSDTFYVSYRCPELLYRKVRKFYGHDLIKSVPRRLRNNGRITLDAATYLGRF